MKLHLLTALALATTGAYAQEYTTVIQGSEQITDIDFENEEGEGPPPHIQCNGPNANRPCPDAMPSPYTCDGGAAMCCRWTNLPRSKTRQQVREFESTVNIPGFGKCTRDGTTESDGIDSFSTVDSSDVDEAEEFAGFLRGIAVESNKCECNRNKDCANNENCRSSSCNTHNGWSGGICVRSGDNKNPNTACNYKQCNHKSDGDCECGDDERCVKGSQYENYCNQSGDKNGCCVYDALLDGQEVE